jgi:hypothetical protein
LLLERDIELIIIYVNFSIPIPTSATHPLEIHTNVLQDALLIAFWFRSNVHLDLHSVPGPDKYPKPPTAEAGAEKYKVTVNDPA